MSNQGQASTPLPSPRQTTPGSSGSGIQQNFPCSCRTGDGTGQYIECDNPDCPVGWYHWQCVQVMEEPLGTWLCPTCSPNAAFYIKQLVRTREAATATSSKEKEPKSEAKKEKVVKKGVAFKKPAPEKPKPRNVGWVELSDEEEEEEEEPTPKPEKASNPSSSKGKGKEKEDRPETKTKPTAKKGIAVKKPAPETPKPKWKGWQELPSDDEEEFKKQVDAKWTENTVIGNRRRPSKALAEEIIRGSRRLRARSRAGETKKEVENESDEADETDDEHSIYQQEEQEEEESKDDEESEEEEEKASIDEASSDSHEESEDGTMDVDESTDHADEDGADEPADPTSDSEAERQGSPGPGLVQENSTSGRNTDASASEGAAEDWEGSMDMDIDQDESVEASSRPSVISIHSEAADCSSLPQELTSATSPAGPSAGSPQNYITISDDEAGSPQDYITISDDDMDVEMEDEAPAHQGQVFAPVTRAVARNNYAALHPQRGIGWGYYRESAIRSTLPRLG